MYPTKLSFLTTPCILLLALATSARAQGRSHDLPAWYENNRVQAHSEHSLGVTLAVTPERHAELIRNLGAKVLTRIFRNREEGAWWPTRVGERNPQAGGRDVAAEIVQACHSRGLKVIAYHRHMCDAAMEREHPEWICRNLDGSIVYEPRGKKNTPPLLCLNSPFREFIETRLVELADRGVDAIYFDSWHMPEVCTCAACREQYLAKTGRPMDLSAAKGSAAYMDIASFVNASVVQAFTEWREAIDRQHPATLMVISSSRYPMFTAPQIDSRLLAISAPSKTEFYKPFGGPPAAMAKEPDFAAPDFDLQLALGWSLVRDASDGRPPLMWIPFLRDEREALYSTAAAVSYGSAVGLNISLNNMEQLEGLVSEAQRVFPSSFALGEKLSPWLAFARPMPWAGLHVSEHARNARYPGQSALWQEVFSPALGACQALKEKHVPWVTVSDLQLAKEMPAAMKLLVLPWPGELTDRQRAVVSEFESRGGAVIRLNPQFGWHKRGSKTALLADLKARIRGASPAPPVRITGPDAMHSVVFDRPDARRLTICLANTWGWFESAREPRPRRGEPQACRNVRVELDGLVGAPTKVFDAVTGVTLRTASRDGVIRINVPEFQVNACVVAEY